MKYSLQQIKKYIPALSTIATQDLIAKIWTSIAEVEHVEFLGEKYEGVVVAKVLTIEPHPKSEKLVITTIDCGQKEPVTVVTAAHNMKKGDFVPYIPDGVFVPVGADERGERIRIGVRTMAGVPSVGMIASEREMGVSDDHSGIMILRQEELRRDLVAGAPIAPVLELDDVIIEIENKALTHRGDCFSAAGLAREIATMYNVELQIPEWQKPSFEIPALHGDAFDKEFTTSLDITVSATAAVERYSAIVLEGIQVAPSPLWLRIFLSKHGINTVNNIVDITNFVMLEYGQPMHAFDATEVTHKKRDEKVEYVINVRYAKPGETIVALDGKEKKLPPIATMIADSQKALGIAGIIGGKESGITENSNRIILESAVFNKYAIRNASMSLGVITDASVVFSRKQDPEKTVRALLRAVHLMQELAGASVASPIADNYPPQKLSSLIVLSHQKLEQFIGISISPSKVVQVLEGLGCIVTKKNSMYRIDTPSWRPDLAIDEDIYEEVARMIGYNEIVPDLPKRGIFGVTLGRYEKVKQLTIKTLVALGLTQTLNFSFVSKRLYQQAQVSLKDARAITNAISPEVEYVRKQLVPQMVDQLARNQYHADTFGMFEIGKTSRKGLSYTGASVTGEHLPESVFGVDEIGLPIEDEHVSLGVVSEGEQPAYYVLKEALSRYLRELRIDVAYLHPDDYGAKKLKLLPVWMQELLSHYKHGRVALVVEKSSEDFLGLLGEPVTLVEKSLNLTKKVATAELTLHKIIRHAKLEPQYREPSRYPTVTEDFCFEVPPEVLYSQINDAFGQVLSRYRDEFTAKLSPRDIFQKKSDVKQVTNRIVYEPVVERFSDETRKKFRTSLIDEMKKLGGKLI